MLTDVPADAACRRSLTIIDADGASSLCTLWIGIARHVDDQIWACDFGFATDAKASWKKYAVDGVVNGIDGMQAMQLALDAVRRTFDAVPATISWLDVADWHGIYEAVIGFSLKMQRHLEAMLRTEVIVSVMPSMNPRHVTRCSSNFATTQTSRAETRWSRAHKQLLREESNLSG